MLVGENMTELFAECKAEIKKIPLDPPLQKGEGFEMIPTSSPL
jgi:hypothetical protein